MDFEIATFSSMNAVAEHHSNKDILVDAISVATKLFESGDYFDVEVISNDPNDPDPIKWIKTK